MFMSRHGVNRAHPSGIVESETDCYRMASDRDDHRRRHRVDHVDYSIEGSEKRLMKGIGLRDDGVDCAHMIRYL